jgi:DNA polymerase I
VNVFESDAYAKECALIDRITNPMTRAGVTTAVARAQVLLATMETELALLADELQRTFPPITKYEPFTPKRNNKVRGLVKGVTIQRPKIIPFNPNSSQQDAERATLLGYKHEDFTDSGAPCMNAMVIQKIAALHPEFLPLLGYKITGKRITMMTGEKGWLTVVDPDGRLRTTYHTLGTVTGRCSHSPNIAQVPRIVLDQDGNPILGPAGGWGYECRSLFGAPDGWYMVGSDMKGLELRILGHYLFPFDQGAYVIVVISGDPHALTQQATGLSSRAKAKTLNFAFIYGCGNYKAGHIVEPDELDEYMVRHIGAETKKLLVQGIPGFADLFKWLDTQNQLWGLDGRPLFVRKAHAKLNTLLQAGGAIVCKRWLLLVDNALRSLGLRPDEDFEWMLWVHDELGIAARTMEIAEQVAEVCKEQAVKAGEYYSMDCPLAADARIGRTWAEVH